MPSAARTPKIRTTAACLASADQEARVNILPASAQWQAAAPAWKLNADNPRLVLLVEQVRRAQLADTVGTMGITIALVGLVWIFGKCAPALLPVLFG